VKKETTETIATAAKVHQILIEYFRKNEKLTDALSCGNLLAFEELLREQMQTFQSDVT
jgi:hypothetical protein